MHTGFTIVLSSIVALRGFVSDELQVPTRALDIVLQDHIWCGTGSSIAIFDPKKRRVVEHIVSADGTSYTSRDKDDTKPNTPLPSADDSAAADAGWGMPRNRTVPSRVRSASTGTTVRDAARAAVSARQRLQHTASPVLGGGAGIVQCYLWTLG